LFWCGEHLESVAKTQNKYIEIILQYKQETVGDFAKIWHQLVLNLLDRAEDKYQLIGESFNEVKMLPIFKANNNNVGLACVYLAKLILAYLFKNYSGAIENAKSIENYQESISGLIHSTQHNFYFSLALLAKYPNVSETDQKKYIKQVKSNQKRMKEWSVYAACNFEHKYNLVEAEKARVLGQFIQAIDLYDKAIIGAKNNGYIQEEALANELTAEFYLLQNKDKIAKTYMTEAYYGYIRWGAIAKVKDLDERYPKLISRTIIQESDNISITRTTSTSTSSGKESQILDLTTVIKASLALSGEIVIGNLLDKLLKISIENAGAQKGLFISKSDNQWIVEAEATVEKNEVKVSHTATSAGSGNLPISLLNYVERTRKSSVLDNAKEAEIFANDPYILANQTKSVLCSPIIYQGKLTGILYLENNLIIGAFTSDRLNVLNLLTSQISISIENARLYTNLQSYSQRLENKSQELEAKSQELEIKNAALQASELREREKAQALEQSLHELQQTQAQLVQTEKISSLGQLVAGVAHEVNNPVSFISGNLHYATQYVEDLLGLVQLYQQHYPEPNPEIAEEIEAIELDYLVEDLPKMLSSMNLGTERIREIMQSLRNFSRVDDAQAKPADIHAGLDSTLMILHHRLKANAVRPAVELMKEYGQLPLVECYPGQLNQVFMNLIANAIDAFDEFNRGKTFAEIERQPNMIRIRTEVSQGASNDHSTGGRAIIRIADNGHGMSADTLSKLFQPFFTTKPVGKGTGLGLSISYKIVVEKHHGSLRCTSTPGEGTEFIIEIPILQSKEVREVAVEN
jgi:signal transduction histidine kinase